MVKRLGPPAFIAGFVLSILASVLTQYIPMTPNQIPLIVACLGIIVGLINITDKEVPGFLLAAIAFTVSAGSLATVFANVPGLLTAAPMFFNYIVTFTAPAAGVVAFKQIWMLAKD